jgi:outer membrane protein OmpA-like peptidoglycan-associated protein
MKTRIPLLLASAGVFALGACAQGGDPYATGAGTGTGAGMSRAQQGALAGAVVGGILGATRDHDKNGQGKDALKGAIVGAAIGGVGGAILDQQQKALQQSLNNPNIRVVNNGKYLTVVMPESTLFATDSAAYNPDLSARRARSVAGILPAGGVSSNRVSTAGRGASNPVASNETASGRAQNRRVEILIVPPG